LESDVSANVLAHFEYGVRYIPITTEQFIEGARNFVDKVLDLVIQKEMALEINTRSMYQYRKIDLYDYVTDCYIKKGGRLFSVGSDAHQVGVYQYHFDDAVHFLKQKNVKEIALFEKGEFSLQELE
jgi:histidinol phosphate phosphatase hisJ family protein